MTRVYFPGGSMSVADDYKPGDMPPTGYIARQEWADVQMKAGLKQVPCNHCGKWLFPQQVARETTRVLRNSMGAPVNVKGYVCKACDAGETNAD
jgi:hypothetical protein